MKTANKPHRSARPSWLLPLLPLLWLLWLLWLFDPLEAVRAAQYLDFTYAVSGSNVTITKYTGPGGSVTIPDAIEGKPVIAIGGAAFGDRYSLTHITIPDRVTSLGVYAFGGCPLTSITLPNSLTNIGDSAFDSCSHLTACVVPDRVQAIGQFAFRHCTNMTGVTLGKGVTDIGDSAFYLCAGLRSANIPDRVTRIANDLFLNCHSLTNLAIPQGVLAIGEAAFGNCYGLTDMSIPDSVTRIGGKAFLGCTNLTRMAIPFSVTNIGTGPFADCKNLRTIIVDPRNAFYAGANGLLFDRNQTTLIQAVNTLAGTYAIPDTVTEIGGSAFLGCAGLTDIAIPFSVTNIATMAFQACAGLTRITLPASVTQLGVQVFYGCVGLTNISIPQGVRSLGSDMFSQCTNLTQVRFEGDAPTTGDTIFRETNPQLTVYYRAGTTGWGKSFAGRPTALWNPSPSYQEWAQASGLTVKFPNASGETDDADGDGMTNQAEMLAGTDPTDPRSRLAFDSAPRMNDLTDADKSLIGATELALYFQSVPGKTYGLQSVDPLGGVWQTETTVTATTTQKRVVRNRPVATRFYRLTIQP